MPSNTSCRPYARIAFSFTRAIHRVTLVFIVVFCFSLSIRLSFAVFLRRLFFRIVKRSNAVNNNKNKYITNISQNKYERRRIYVVLLIVVTPRVKMCRSYEPCARVFEVLRRIVFANCEGKRREKAK